MEKQRQLSSSQKNQEFGRDSTPEDTRLLQKGEQIYHQLKEDPEKTLDKLHSYTLSIVDSIEILIERKSEQLYNQLHRTRIILNGIMDAAGENDDSKICMETKTILEEFFDLQD